MKALSKLRTAVLGASNLLFINVLRVAAAVLGASNLLFINVLRVAAAVQDAQTLTFGDHTFEVDFSGTAAITSGNVRVDLSGSGTLAAAVGTLTSDNTNVADGEAVVIGSKTYTFRTALTPTEGEVLIGADADGSLLNLIRAINHSGTPGTHYSCAAENTQVTAATSVTSHAFVVTAIAKGTVGNAIATTESSSHLSWGASTLASGADATAAEFTTALETAVNAAGLNLLADRISANEVLFIDTSVQSQQRSKPCSETLAGSNNVWAAANSFGGDQSISPPKLLITSRVPITTEVTLETMHFALPFTQTSALVQVRSSAGLIRAFDGKLTIGGNIIDVLSDGSVKVQASDVVTISAYA